MKPLRILDTLAALRGGVAATKSQRFWRECTRCGDRFASATFVQCAVCRFRSRERGLAWRAEHKRLGLCFKCVAVRRKGGASCQYHLEWYNAYQLKSRRARRKAGLCGVHGCPEHSAGYHCERHAALHAAYQADYIARRARAARRRGAKSGR